MVLYFTTTNTFFPDGFVFHDNKHIFFQMVLYFTTTNTFFPEGLYYLLIAKDAFASKLCMVMFTRIVSIILTAQVQRNC